MEYLTEISKRDYLSDATHVFQNRKDQILAVAIPAYKKRVAAAFFRDAFWDFKSVIKYMVKKMFVKLGGIRVQPVTFLLPYCKAEIGGSQADQILMHLTSEGEYWSF